MFYYSVSLLRSGIYVAAALIPAVILLAYIYKKDSVEKEPPSLLFKLLCGGLAAAAVSVILEKIGSAVLDAGFITQGSPIYYIILAFFVVAVVEEGTKLFMLKRLSWKNPSFNYRFDGVVYAVFVSLGFAAIENVCYVFIYGLKTAVLRAVLSVPGHMGFAVFMGVFYGRAKLCEQRRDNSGKIKNLIISFVSAVFLHGFYDSCCMIEGTLPTVLFICFVIVMYIVVFRLIKKEAATDVPIPSYEVLNPEYYPPYGQPGGYYNPNSNGGYSAPGTNGGYTVPGTYGDYTAPGTYSGYTVPGTNGGYTAPDTGNSTDNGNPPADNENPSDQ